MPQIELSWTSLRLESGDFSPEDPLAIDHLQQQIGNILWPGFTTRTNRAFYYVMVCYGLRIIDDLLSKYGITATDDNRRTWFERWEKLWALAICASFDGAIPSGDAMRGKRGVIRAWHSGDRLFLGYPLLSRQLELGAMGAYRSSLVQHRLLSPNALLPTPIGAELGERMWAREEGGAQFDGFIGECLEPNTTYAPLKHGTTTLKSLGYRCRLSIVRHRADLQHTLGGLLIDDHPPPPELRVLPEMSRHLASARKAQVDHPKVSSVVEEAMSAADHWEKSLIFCERNRTIGSLQEEIEKRWMNRLLVRWQRMYPEADMEAVFGAGSRDERRTGIFQRWATRFTRGQDELSVALRESYPHTLFVGPDEPGLRRDIWHDTSALIGDANDVLRTQRAKGTGAERLDWRLAVRCIDVAVARWFEKRDVAALDRYEGLPRRLLDPRYLPLGFDFVDSETEADTEADGSHPVPIEWSISEETLKTLFDPNRRSIWFPYRRQLAEWDAVERVAIVEAVRKFLTRRQVPFLLEVLERAGHSRATSASFRDALESWWIDPDCLWSRYLSEFLEYLPQLGADDRAEILQNALPLGEFAVQGNGERRQKIRDAFNTPFFPMILVGNKTMQEGLNLQRQCRRVVHHDLRWNPADIEQRIGRVDRHGSLAERQLTESGGSRGHIIVDTPLLQRTIDPSRYRRVKEREKWLDFLLGVPPDIGRGNLDARETLPLPVALSRDLRVRLQPRIWKA